MPSTLPYEKPDGSFRYSSGIPQVIKLTSKETDQGCNYYVNCLSRSVAPSPEPYRVVQQQMNEKIEHDGEYEIEVDAYHPVQPLPYDHGVSFVSMLSSHTKIDQHIIQVSIICFYLSLFETRNFGKRNTCCSIFYYCHSIEQTQHYIEFL